MPSETVGRTEPSTADATEDLPEQVREALREEGFDWTIWQKPQSGVLFGMVREEDDLQTHVRYYEDDVIRAEHEICHRYLEHLISPRESAHDEIERILDEHGIDGAEVQEKDFPDRMKGEMPSTRTPWKPLVAGVGALVVGAVFGGRSLLSFRDD